MVTVQVLTLLDPQVYIRNKHTRGQYKIGNRILISGNDLGGNSPNDLIITADTVGTRVMEISSKLKKDQVHCSTLTVYSTVSITKQQPTHPLSPL